jgi:hypothetical protein
LTRGRRQNGKLHRSTCRWRKLKGVCEGSEAIVGADVAAIIEGAEAMASAVVAAAATTEGTGDMFGAVVVAAAELALFGLVVVSLIPSTVPRIITKTITTIPVQTKARR